MKRFWFFAGKGGVGKTTTAAAAAVQHALGGAQVLAISTDPAHSLGDALATKLGPTPRRVRLPPSPHGGTLDAAEIDAPAAARAWLDAHTPALRLLAERGTILAAQEIDELLRLSLPGADELFGLMEIERLAADYDDVVVDTAPTGHTLRLLTMPETLDRLANLLDAMEGKHRALADAFGGSIRPGDAGEALISEIEARARSLGALLRDPGTEITFLMLPEALSLAETIDGVAALEAAGIPVRRIQINRVTPPPPERCDFCETRRAAEREVIREVVERWSDRDLLAAPALEQEPRGPAVLADMPWRRPDELISPRGDRSTRSLRTRAAPDDRTVEGSDPLSVSAKLVLFGGKGGVGKSTSAAAYAIAASDAHPRERILLLSTDPAHSLGDVLELEVGDVARAIPGTSAGLRVREQDAAAAFAKRREELRDAADALFAAVGRSGGVDATYDRQVVQDLLELTPPGLDEMLAVLAVMDALVPEKGRPTWDRVVVDTAPTGHALRLLELPALALEWVHALMRIILAYRAATGLGGLAEELIALARRIERFQALLADPKQCAFVIVTRPGELPRLETERLAKSLGRLEVPLAAIVVNALTPADGCSRCRHIAEEEARAGARARVGGDPAILRAPAVAPPPRGPAALRRWLATWSRSERNRAARSGATPASASARAPARKRRTSTRSSAPRKRRRSSRRRPASRAPGRCARSRPARGST